MEEICRQLQEFLTNHGVPEFLVVLIISMLPIFECRLGMLTAITFLEMNPLQGFIISIIGNLIPLPFILILINKIFEWLKKIKHINKPILWLEKHTLAKRDKIDKYGIWGLLIFVAIPLPGTGGWTGALLASLLGLDKKKSFGVISVGVLIAGIIMFIVSYGLKLAIF